MLILGVPTLNRYDLLHRMLQSVLSGSVVPDRIVIVDNGQRLRDRYDENERVEVVRPAGNLGVAASWNHLLRRYAEHDVIVSNDDLTVRREGIERLTAPEAPCVLGGGFSLFLWRPGLTKEIGEFDEGFWPAYYEDADMMLRLHRAGIPVARVRDVVDKHDRSATVKRNPAIKHLAAGCRARFIAKWGRLLPPGWNDQDAEVPRLNATPWGL
jgi:GT2 family glycosyltransferase